MPDFTVSSTGFVNYFPSSERTARKVAAAYEKHGDDIAIVDGEDDWNANRIFNVDFILDKAEIQMVDSFHTGISGITKSGAVINKEDLPKFIDWVEKNKIRILSTEKGRSFMCKLKWYDKENAQWVTLVEGT